MLLSLSRLQWIPGSLYPTAFEICFTSGRRFVTNLPKVTASIVAAGFLVHRKVPWLATLHTAGYPVMQAFNLFVDLFWAEGNNMAIVAIKVYANLDTIEQDTISGS